MFCFSKLLETNTMEHHFSTRVYTQNQNQNKSNLLISLAFFLFVTLMYGFMALSDMWIIISFLDKIRRQTAIFLPKEFAELLRREANSVGNFRNIGAPLFQKRAPTLDTDCPDEFYR